MKPCRPELFAAVLAAFWALSPARAAGRPLEIGGGDRPADPLAAATLVVFNKNDLHSAELAGNYAAARGVPMGQVVGLDCPQVEEIPRAEYDLSIAAPLRREFLRNGWWRVEGDPARERIVVENKIRFIALIRGIPLKIAAAQGLPGDIPPSPPQPPQIAARNEASVDSELAVLGRFSPVVSGVVDNPYYRRFTPIADAGLPGLMLVTRLDAPTPGAVRRMIADSLRVEREGLYGFCYADLRGIQEEGLVIGDRWILAAAEDAQRAGFPVVADGAPDQFASGYPMESAALYFGWYSQDIAGPLAAPEFAFRPGAVAIHIHSFSAGTLRDPARCWVGGLVERGAAASAGNVYEPYLGLTCDLGILQTRLRGGLAFAEACYASVKGVSWVNTFVGDPLYRPFRAWNDAIDGPSGVPAEWLAYREGAARWFRDGRAAGEAELKKRAAEKKSGLLWEGLGLLQAGAGDREASYASFGKARSAYRAPAAILRCALHEANLLRFSGKKKESLALVRKWIKAYPDQPAAAVLRGIERELEPPPPPPSPSPSPPGQPPPGASPPKR